MRYSLSITMLLILALFLMTACSSGTTSPNGNPFIGGSKAVEMSFISGAPPKEISDNKQGSFQVTVQLKNIGENDISTNDGYVQIEGISPRDFGVSDAEFKHNVPALKGARKTNSGTISSGGVDLVTFGPLTYQSNINGNVMSSTIIAKACYNYQTRATTKVCITKTGSDDPNKKTIACKVEEEKALANSAGPLQVSKFRQIPLSGGKVQVDFEVGKSATSMSEVFFKKDTNCDEGSQNMNKYVVHVKVLPIVNDMYQAQCISLGSGSSEGDITLWDGVPRQVQCTFNVGNTDSEFQTPVNIELSYRYMQTASVALLVKDNN